MKNGLKNTASEDQKHLGEIIQEIQVGMLTTVREDGGLCSRPMYAQEIDGNGSVWFFTSQDSELVKEVRGNSRVNLSFSSVVKNKYVSASGTAWEVSDRKKMEELWSPAYKAWYPNGLQTAGIILLRVDLDTAEYWDAPGSPVVKAIEFVKAVTGRTAYGIARHEKLELRSRGL